MASLAAVLAGAASCLIPTAHDAVTAAYVFPVHETVLPSGLRVVIEQDDSSGVAGVVWVVDAGHADDPPAKAGLAHMVEHLTMSAPDTARASILVQLRDMGAVAVNASTAYETTTFHAFAPAAQLEELVAVTSKRMADPAAGVDDAMLAKERAVVEEEMHLREGLAAAAGARLAVSALMPAGHPYARSLQEMQQAAPGLSLADVRAFVAQRYTPRRTTLLISGPVPAAWEQWLARALPPALVGTEGGRQAPERRAPAQAEPTIRPAAPLEARALPVMAPELWIAWRLPPALGAGAAPLYVLADLANQLLAQDLRGQALPDATSAHVEVVAGALASVLLCRIVLRPSGDPTRVAHRITERVASLANLRLGTFSRSLGRTLRVAVLATALSYDAPTARLLTRAALAHRTPGAKLGDMLDALQSVSAEAVASLAEPYLPVERARMALVVPASGPVVTAAQQPPLHHRPVGAGDAMLPMAELEDTAPAGAGPETHASDGDGAVQGADADDPVRAPGVGAATVTRLRNGLTVIVLRRPGLPLVSLLLGFHAAPATGERPGARVAAIYARKHALHLDALDRWLLQTFTRDHDSYREDLSAFSNNAGEALIFLADEVDSLQVRAQTPELLAVADRAAAFWNTPEAQAQRSFSRSLWGDHPYGVTATPDQVRAASTDDVKAWLARVWRPANGVLVAVGELNEQRFAQEAANELGGWEGATTAPSPAPPPPPLRPPGTPLPLQVTLDPRRSLADAHFGCFLSPVRARRDEVAALILSEVIREDIFREVRERLGASYTPSVSMLSLRGGTAFLGGDLDLDPAALPAALEVLRRWLDPTGTATVDAEALVRARRVVARRSIFRFSSNHGVARALFDAWNEGWSPADLDRLPADIASITAADLDTSLGACRATAVLSVVSPTAP
jgi:zinc protease